MSLKTNTANPGPSQERIDRNFTCWEQGNNSECLRLELSTGEVLLLPYAHFSSARHHAGNDGEILQITFSTHGLTIKGRDLRQIAAAFQNFSVQSIIELSPRYRNLREISGPLITSIQVAAVE
jgi:hypothetical protein